MTDQWIFITGGCGFIGSNLAAVLKEKTDYKILLIDKRADVLKHTVRYSHEYADEEFDSDLIKQTIFDRKPVSVIHLGAVPTIEAGLGNPINQWQNNVSKSINLIDACMTANVESFIFASTSSLYIDSDDAVSEISPIEAIHSYASSKLAIEHVLRDCWNSYKFSSITLRLFNVAGAHNHYDLGELGGNTHLFSSIMNAIVNKVPFSVYGKDWPTNDGTAIRDFTHVLDVADAIIETIEWSKTCRGNHLFNVGKGKGNSIQEIINTIESTFSTELPYRYSDRRHGDTAKRFANIDKIKSEIGWKPTRSLEDIIRDSFKWYNSVTYKNLTNAGIFST